MAKNYINNRDFSNAVDEWIERRQNDNTAKMSDYLGMCILTLVNKFASRYNFSNYTYLDDMKTEALYLSTKYAHNYNSTKGDGNAFGYFSRIVERAFVTVINKEKTIAEDKFNYIKYLCEIEGYDYKNCVIESDEYTTQDNVDTNHKVMCIFCSKMIPQRQNKIEDHLLKHDIIIPHLVFPISTILENKKGCNNCLDELSEFDKIYVSNFIMATRYKMAPLDYRKDMTYATV